MKPDFTMHSEASQAHTDARTHACLHTEQEMVPHI